MKSKIAETLIASLGTQFFLFLIIPFFVIWIPNKILVSLNIFTDLTSVDIDILG